MKTTLKLIGLLLLSSHHHASAQTTTDFMFTGLPSDIGGGAFRFSNIGTLNNDGITTLDLIATTSQPLGTATTYGLDPSFAPLSPGFESGSNGPTPGTLNELGLAYRSLQAAGNTAPGIGGFDFTFQFVLGGTMTAQSIPEFSVMITDVDGQPQSTGPNRPLQFETVGAFFADGLVSYQLAGSSHLTTTGYTYGADIGLVNSIPGDVPDNDPQGGVIFNYENSETFTIRLAADTGAIPGGGPHNDSVLSVLTGDFSIIPRSDFGTTVAVVPEPTTILLSALGGIALILRRKRSS